MDLDPDPRTAPSELRRTTISSSSIATSWPSASLLDRWSGVVLLRVGVLRVLDPDARGVHLISKSRTQAPQRLQRTCRLRRRNVYSLRWTHLRTLSAPDRLDEGGM